MSEFQPQDREQDRDAMAEAWLDSKERAGYLVMSRADYRERLSAAQTDAYAEGRADEREAIMVEFSELLPGPYYMDPPDGGGVTVYEQFLRMSHDARMWREQK